MISGQELVPSKRDRGTEQWLANDALFFEEARKGQKWQDYVAKKLSAEEGIIATSDSLTLRDNVKDRHDYANQKDIVVEAPAGRFVIEVKSRSLKFTGRANFPFSDTIVETVGSFKGRNFTPDFWVMVSQLTGGMFVLSYKTKEFWTVKDTFDTVRKITDATYYCPTRKAMSYELFVERLQGK